MSQIALLSQETIDKIAAGEVVERPSSVVKELVENAIDAKATAVTVEIKEGGTSFIRVTDNGCGIEHTDVAVAFLRHSTSKIKSVEDLLCVQSLGFRGEALSSIAAVSQVELITKTCSALTGSRYVIEGSKEKELEEIGAPDGTTFIVRNLFYNIPARRKFLKTAQTEGNYINDLIERLALSHPNISFKFISNGQTKLHTSGNSNAKDMIYHIYGRDITASMLPIHAQTDLFSVDGFIGKPLISRGNRSYENYFINGRYIKSALLSKSVEDAYKGFIMQHQYPFCILYFTIDTELLDVNVHPTKMELRFSGQEELYQKLHRVIRDTLMEKELIPEVPLEEQKEIQIPIIEQNIPEPFEKRRLQDIRASIAKDSPYELKYPGRDPFGQEQAANRVVFDKLVSKTGSFQSEKKSSDETTPGAGEYFSGNMQDGNLSQSRAQCMLKESMLYTAESSEETDIARKRAEQQNLYEQQSFFSAEKSGQTDDTEAKNAAIPSKETQFLTKSARKKHKIIGQLFSTYWIVEYEDKMFLIDQHAAHEKVLYEKTMDRLQSSTFSSQVISPPIILTLSRSEEEVLRRYQEQIQEFGYEIAHFGGKEYAVNAVPAEFEKIDVRGMLLELLDEFSHLSGKDSPTVILEKVASISCKAAVKGNQRLNQLEVEQLLEELLDLAHPYHCPHGRPTIISMSKYEIEKKFKRIV